MARIFKSKKAYNNMMAAKGGAKIMFKAMPGMQKVRVKGRHMNVSNMRPLRLMNKKGQMFLVWLLMGIMALIMFSAMTPAIIKTFGIQKGNNGLNCVDYIDPDATAQQNYSYDSTKNTDATACTVVSFGPALLILAVLFAVIIKIVYGERSEPQQVPGY